MLDTHQQNKKKKRKRESVQRIENMDGTPATREVGIGGSLGKKKLKSILHESHR